MTDYTCRLHTNDECINNGEYIDENRYMPRLLKADSFRVSKLTDSAGNFAPRISLYDINPNSILFEEEGRRCGYREYCLSRYGYTLQDAFNKLCESIERMGWPPLLIDTDTKYYFTKLRNGKEWAVVYYKLHTGVYCACLRSNVKYTCCTIV